MTFFWRPYYAGRCKLNCVLANSIIRSLYLTTAIANETGGKKLASLHAKWKDLPLAEKEEYTRRVALNRQEEPQPLSPEARLKMRRRTIKDIEVKVSILLLFLYEPLTNSFPGGLILIVLTKRLNLQDIYETSATSCAAQTRNEKMDIFYISTKNCRICFY